MVVSKKLKFKKGIYLLTIENHKYVGSSVNLYTRLLRHNSSLKSGIHENQILQRCIDKYGIDKLQYRVLEICSNDIEYIELLKREKYYIEKENTDLNIKLDPVTQQGALTIVRPVYQFDKFGTFIKRWDSMAEASRYYKISSSNIGVACSNPQRQRIAAGFLWSTSPEYPYPIPIIYVFDKEGTLLSKHADTVDIYETYFQNSARKTVLSTLKKKIDSNIPYKYYYLSTNKDFKIPKKITYNPTFIALLQENNPIINIYNEKGKLVSAKRFTEYAGYHRLAKRIESENIVDITQPITEINLHVDNSKKSVQVKVKKLSTNEIIKYPSVVKAVINTFGSYDTNIYKNVIKHMNRQSPYKGFLFIRDC
jgi:phosphotransferase system IIB component